MDNYRQSVSSLSNTLSPVGNRLDCTVNIVQDQSTRYFRNTSLAVVENAQSSKKRIGLIQYFPAVTDRLVVQ